MDLARNTVTKAQESESESECKSEHGRLSTQKNTATAVLKS